MEIKDAIDRALEARAIYRATVIELKNHLRCGDTVIPDLSGESVIDARELESLQVDIHLAAAGIL